MPRHPDLDLLALLALGEDVLDADAARHVEACPACTGTVADLARTVRTVRGPREDEASPTGPARTPPVPAHVWQGIAAELGLDPSVRPASVGPSIVPAMARPRRPLSPAVVTPTPGPAAAAPRETTAAPTDVASDVSTDAPTHAPTDAPTVAPSDARTGVSSGASPVTSRDDLAARRPERSRLRRLAPVLAVAAAGLAVGVAGSAVVASLGPQGPGAGPEVLAAADLEAFGVGAGTSVSGSARLSARPAPTDAADPGAVGPDGAPADRVLQVWLDELPEAGDDGFLEAWLIDPATGSMVSLGPVDARQDRTVTVELTVPRGLDVGTYSLVDVSAEPLDGDPTHSGDSLLRGTLST